jgi:serine/threonine protein kinase
MPLEETLSLVGSVLDGKYEIESLIGTGGMGSVYAGHHKVLGKRVAIKVLHPWLAGESRSCQRFLQEARAISALNHPNVVAVDSCGRVGDIVYIAMEFLDGESLADRIKRLGRLPVEEAVQIVEAAAYGLGHAHSAGILHRDVKPSNIMLCSDSEGKTIVKVVDFGIAKIIQPDHADSAPQNLTSTNSAIGTPYYMSPEQCAHQDLDARADVYSLGCVLFECLSGTVPFAGDSPLAIMLAHLHEEPAALPQNIPVYLQAVTDKAMETDRDSRYQSMREFADGLRSKDAAPNVVRRKKSPRVKHKATNKVLMGAIALGCMCIVGFAWYLVNNGPKAPEVETQRHGPNDELRLANNIRALGKEGSDSVAAQKYKEAISQYERAIALGENFPKDASRTSRRTYLALFRDLLGTYLLVGDVAAVDRTTTRWLNDALLLEGDRSPFYALALVHRGNYLFKTKKIDEARKCFKKAAEIAGEHSHAKNAEEFSTAANALLYTSEYYVLLDGPATEAAVKQAVEAFRTSPHVDHVALADANYSLVEVRLAQKKYTEAEQTFAICMKNAEGLPDGIDEANYQSRYGQKLFALQKYQDALEHFISAEKAAARIKKPEFKVWVGACNRVWRVRTLICLHRFDEAQRLLDPIKDKKYDPGNNEAIKKLQADLRKNGTKPG